MSLTEIKTAIEQLSFEERAELAAWLHGWKDDEWDDGSSLSTKAKRSLNYQLRSCCLFDFAQNIVEFAGRDVPLHLLVPLIISPTMQPCRKLSALFERELFDCSFDFGQAHFTIVMLEIRRRNAREVSIVGSDPLLPFEI